MVTSQLPHVPKRQSDAHPNIYPTIFMLPSLLHFIAVFNSIQHKSFIACGNTIMRLNCSSTNDILKIIGASYGRFTSFLCHPNSWPTPSSQWDLQCSARGSFAIASERLVVIRGSVWCLLNREYSAE